MKINDVIYGDFKIKEPVLIDLINSKPVQRLKGIEQYGIPKELYLFPGFSRYDHSIGAMLLLQKLNATLEEQIAGLLHDISTTAFSHIIDWVLGRQAKEDYHDEIHNTVIENSGIPQILSTYNFDVEIIINIESYSLLEKEAPDLCADRADYALREFHQWANPKIVKICVDNLTVYKGKIVFASKKSAEAFGRNYLKCQTEHWGETDAVLRYHLFSQALKIALREKIIALEDFYKNDIYVMKKLKASKNIQINKLLQVLSGKIHFEWNEKNPQLRLKKKFRYIDPEYLKNGNLHRLSKTDSNFKSFLEKQREINKKGVNVILL